MRDFAILTDSGCDVDAQTLAQWDVERLSLTYTFEGIEGVFHDDDIDIKKFYDDMRSGLVVRTAAIGIGVYEEAFRRVLESGKDVLYLGMSSGISSTVDSAEMATDDLRKEFPEATIAIVDTLSMSAGQAMIVDMCARFKKIGRSLQEIVAYVERIRDKVCHDFTVDDLIYLARGGRVSAAAANIGGLLRIKPMLHVNLQGELKATGKVRGREKSVNALVDKLKNRNADEDFPVYLCHGDSPDDVAELQGKIRDKYGIEVDRIVDVGPVIGAHSGPGSLAVFYCGTR